MARVPKVGDLVRVVSSHSTYPNRLGHVVRRSPHTGVEVRFFNGHHRRIGELWVVGESVHNLNNEEVAELMKLNLKGQI